MNDDLRTVVERLVATTAASSQDILAAISVLKANDAWLPEPWSEETVARALPAIVEMAASSRSSVREIATSVRAVAACGGSDRGATA